MIVGIDVGSAAVKLAVLDEDGDIVWSGEEPAAGRPLVALARLLEGVEAGRFRLGLTGAGRDLLSVPGAAPASALVASARGAAALVPGARGVIDIGGQASRWAALGDDGDLDDFALSELCAAGAGSFLEQQAARLGFDVAELARRAAAAPQGATVAGRCAVFAKSDMIHLQQKGTPVDEIAYGLCLALARNFQARVIRGRTLPDTVAFVGGCTRNAGLVRAFEEVLDRPVHVPAAAPWAGAVGAALLARDAPEVRRADLARAAAAPRGGTLSRVEPLPDPACALPRPEPTGEGVNGGVVLGMDVGSVSTDLVLLSPTGEVLDAVYLPTRGRPVDVMAEAIGIIRDRHGSGLEVLGVGVTGSGRHLGGRFLGADLVKNEITAQLRGAVEAVPDVDTVFEIGGQDAKYIHARDGHIEHFAMNHLCAAGTGSFLEEQASRLDVSIKDEFARLAMASEAPPDLGRRCTVFMESEMVHAMQQGASTSDVTAGLALSVVRNYLDRVVAGRPVGERVVFQGGTASNRAVVAAFRQVLGRPVEVHPYNRISGAMGAALLVLDARREGTLGDGTRFRGLDGCEARHERSFVCKHCDNHCLVNRFRAGDEAFFFGDACERWSLRQGRDAEPEEGLIARRNALLRAHARVDEAGEEPAMGIPMASMSWSLLPLWAEIVRAAGRRPVVSGPSSTRVLALGLKNLPAETCLPVKMACGQVRALSQDGLEGIFLPSVVAMSGDQTGVCAYVQHLPAMVRATTGARVVAPEVRLDRPPAEVLVRPDALAAELGVEVDALQAGVRRGLEATEAFRRDLLLLGREALAGVGDRAVVVIGKPYNVADAFLNLDLARHLRRAGLPAVPMECLPYDEEPLGARYDALPWALNRDQVRAALLTRRDPRLFPLVVSSFGCGTDGFTAKHLEDLLDGRPRLLLDLDEHRAEAGLVTRVEAFADEIASWLQRRPEPQARPGPTVLTARSRPRTWVPFFSDHAHAFVGALRRQRPDVVLLPPPGDGVRERGEALANGRECHPYALLLGDAVRLVDAGELRPGDVYFFPGTMVPCLLPQYSDGIRLALDRLGAAGVRVDNPDQKKTVETYGVRGAMTLSQALHATDLLLRAFCHARPYARDPGQVDALRGRAMAALERAAEVGGVMRVAREAVDAFASVERDGGGPRPRVGVAGDIYTRTNEFASGGLWRRLEAMGCEVMPAPFGTDVSAFNARVRLQEALRDRDPGRTALTLAFNGVMRGQAWRAWRGLGRGVAGGPALTYERVLAHTAAWLGPGASPIVLTNLATISWFVENGASGVLNAFCFNCMVGSVSAAVMEEMRARLGGVPMSNLVYGGSEGTADDARLEAFVHQVHRFARPSTGGARPV